jgi:nucleoid DNA-binding protein
LEALVDSVLGTITEKLQGNERVDLRGFGERYVNSMFMAMG